MIYGMEGMLVDDGVPIAYKPQDIDLKTATYVVLTLKQQVYLISMIKLSNSQL